MKLGSNAFKILQALDAAAGAIDTTAIAAATGAPIKNIFTYTRPLVKGGYATATKSGGKSFYAITDDGRALIAAGGVEAKTPRKAGKKRRKSPPPRWQEDRTEAGHTGGYVLQRRHLQRWLPTHHRRGRHAGTERGRSGRVGGILSAAFR